MNLPKLKTPVSYVRYSEAGHLIENFIVSAVTSILIIRVFLRVTGYPQLGAEGIHIAHLLWGGFFMMAAIIVLLTFLNKEAKNFAAFLGGIGFGTFIDELGKFLTSDNNYFFQPTIAIIYIIFVLLFLLYRAVERSRKLTRREYISNALEFSKDIVSHDFDVVEKRRLLGFLKKSDEDDPVVIALKRLVAQVEASPAEEPNLVNQARENLEDFYEDLVEKSWFKKGIIIFFVLVSVISLLDAVTLIGPDLTFTQIGQVVSSIISGLLVLVGVNSFRKSRLTGLQMFKRSVLVSILITQLFLFYSNQLQAIYGLVFNIFILITLQYMIENERLYKIKKA